jgi:hypothetical protein
MSFKHIFLACSLAAGLLFSLNAIAEPSRIFWSQDGTNLGSDNVRVYTGSSRVVAMKNFEGGVLTAFAGTQGFGNRIHWSADGENLGTGQIRYDGTSPVTAMIPYAGGMLVAYTAAGGNGNRIWFSPDGKKLGGGELRYDGSSPVTAMTEYAGGALVAFSNAGGNGNRVWFSPDGKRLGGGELRYDGSTRVNAMLPFKGGMFTAFQGETNQAACGGFFDAACNIGKEAERFGKTIGKTAESIAKNPVEIFPVCWGSPQTCRDDVEKKKTTIPNPPTTYSVSFRVRCKDAQTGANRADTTLTVTSTVSREAAVQEVLRQYETTDLCQSNGDTSRVMVPNSGEWL